MLLKVNQSAQEKEASLRDLFGDNLTAVSKNVLEKAAGKTAHDLAAVIFSPGSRLSDSGESELLVQNL